ncbi:MAG: type VI secretion system lipoprotein TssJ [Planctomycetes bacterium]|nr:type VI secretion system lipoprotein TssJ [Planctomycetota bacterium]
MSRNESVAAAFLGAALLAGCPPPWHGHDSVEVVFQAGDSLNPDIDGHSCPLKVRIYQLRDDEGFLAASPKDLARGARPLPEEDDLISREFTILPPASNPGPLLISLGERVPGARRIGVLALFPGPRAE